MGLGGELGRRPPGWRSRAVIPCARWLTPPLGQWLFRFAQLWELLEPPSAHSPKAAQLACTEVREPPTHASLSLPGPGLAASEPGRAPGGTGAAQRWRLGVGRVGWPSGAHCSRQQGHVLPFDGPCCPWEGLGRAGGARAAARAGLAVGAGSTGSARLAAGSASPRFCGCNLSPLHRPERRAPVALPTPLGKRCGRPCPPPPPPAGAAAPPPSSPSWLPGQFASGAGARCPWRPRARDCGGCGCSTRRVQFALPTKQCCVCSLAGLFPTLVMVAPEKAIKLGVNDAVRRVRLVKWRREAIVV